MNNYYLKNINYLAQRENKSLEELAAIVGIGHDIENPSVKSLLKLSAHFDQPIDVLVKKEMDKTEEVLKRDTQLLITDVDGVLTDGGMYYTENGDAIKKYNAKDGLGIKRLTKKGFRVGIISHSTFKGMVHDRAKTIGITDIYVGKDPKLGVLQDWCSKMGISLENVAYVGDDLNDIDVMEKVGTTACPADATREIKELSDVILSKKGGDGCLREFIDTYLMNSKE